MNSRERAVADGDLARAALVAEFLQLQHEPSRSEVAIGLGSVGLETASTCAGLYHAGLAPLLVFSGRNNPHTAPRFPRGEAVHYRDHAVSLGVPVSDVLVEPRATNTAENIVLTRQLLRGAGIEPTTVLLVAWFSRRPYATARKLWPGVEFRCVSNRFTVSDLGQTGIDPATVINVLIGELQRVMRYSERGFIAQQRIPADVRAAHSSLLKAGYDGRVPPTLVRAL